MEDAGMDRRSAPRRTVAAQVQLRRSGELNHVVEALDLSERGCKVQFVERPRQGETVWVKFEGLEALGSTVRWVGDSAVGLEFNHPLDGRVFELLLRRLG